MFLLNEDLIERAALDWLRDTLLPRLISGELRVGDLQDAAAI